MSEQKRDTLTSIGTNRKEKKSKTLLKTVRFTLGLAESNEEACPEFNYSALLNSAEKKKKPKQKADGQVNGIDPVAEEEEEDDDEAEEDEDDDDEEHNNNNNNNNEGEEADADDDDDDDEEEDEEEEDEDDDEDADDEDVDDEDDDKLKEIARHFEEKYGGKKKHGRYEDYVDLGAGYDETDPFIDNTDAYDEVVPEEMTTAHGGFYINCGALEFKEVSDQSDAEEVRELKTKKNIKRLAIISDDDGENADEKTGNNHEAKKPRLEENDHKEEVVKKKKLHSHDREILKKKKKRAIDDLLKKKSATVKELLREKRELMEMETNLDAHALPDQKKAAPVVPKTNNTSISDVIESVVSAAHEDETSKDSGSSVSKSGSLITTDSEESQDVDLKEKNTPSEEAMLPDNLQDDLRELLVALKTRASESSTEGKCKFFSSEVNSMLLRVEHKCRTLTCSSRQAVYGYLASYLPCTKDTLMKRAKKLLIKDEEDKLLEPIKKLKSAIDRMMPSVLESYSQECQHVAEEKSVEELPSPTSDGEGDKQSVPKSKVPRRRFPWTEEIRNLLCEVVRLKMQCVELVKPRKESADLYLRNFLEKEIKPLWQPGWMKVSTLLRESSKVHANLIIKPKKTGGTKKTATGQPSPIGAIQSATALIQTPTANMKMKSLPSVSISMTPVSNTPQIPNTAKMKPVYNPDASVVYPHISPSVMVRTKCPTNLPVSVSSNIRSSPTSTNMNRLPSVQLVPTPSVSNRKKTVGDVTIAKIPNLSGKSSPNFQLEKQITPATSLKPKVNTERVSPKTLDLSSPNVNRPVLVNNVPDNSSKTKSGCEVNSLSDSVQKTMLLTNLPLMNIPDCISVTPSLPSPSQTVITATVSPPVTSTPKSMMSLKQRILHDTNLDQSKSMNVRTDDDGIEVIEIVKDNKIPESVVLSKQLTKCENVTQSKSEPRKKKKTEISKDSSFSSVVTYADKTPLVDASSSVSTVSPVSSVITSTTSSTTTAAVTTTITTTTTSTATTTIAVTTTTITSTISTPSTITHQLDKEEQLKEEEETAAAADYLSQINESLKNFSNSTPNISNREIFQNEEGLDQCNPESIHSVSPKIDSSPAVLSLLSELKLNPSVVMEEKGKHSHFKGNDLTINIDTLTTPQDNEDSVKMEIDRVMKKLSEIQEQRNAEKSRDMVELDYSPTKTVIPKDATNCSSVSVTVSPSVRTQQTKTNKLYPDNSVMSLLGRRPSSGSTEIAKLAYGFQDEFQKHLFQDSISKQSESEIPNSCKVVKNKPSSTCPQPLHRQSHNSSMEGCVTGSQSRSRTDTNPAIFYPKLLRENMESFSGPAFLNRMPTTFNSGISHLQDLKSSAHIPQSGSSQHSPPY